MFRNCFTPPMQVRAYAKINLGLRVIGKQPDGFHAIDTLFGEIGLYDVLEFEKREDDQIIVSVEGEEIPVKKNLVWHAAWILQKFSPRRPGVNIFLQKNIPIGGGLGGGSSDAAATLKALNKLWGLHFSPDRLSRLAINLGSDIPFFIRGGIQRGRGRGEILDSVELPRAFPREVVLVIPPVKIDTKQAYAAAKFPTQNVELELGDLRNDFEESVFATHPKLLKIKQTLKRAGSSAAALSGSGSTVYGLFATRKEAEAASKRLRKFGEVILTQLRA